MKIILDSDTSDCPGAICKILNESEVMSRLVQSDYDACGVASSFGWSVKDVKGNVAEFDENGNIVKNIKCDHSGTDGTIDCKGCGVKAMQFISSAIEYINSNDGKTAEDPGYFE
jgi:hypothetical protein